jgi:hypothetical protein
LKLLARLHGGIWAGGDFPVVGAILVSK